MINNNQLSFLDKVAIISGWDHFTRAKKTEGLFERFEREPAQNSVEITKRVNLLNSTFKNPQGQEYLEGCYLVFRKIHQIALWILGFLTTVISEKNFEDRVKKIENADSLKTRTAPFLEWLNNEYPEEQNYVTADPSCLWNTHPAVKEGIFVDIKTDGDSIFRSIGTGLILQKRLSKDPKKAFQRLIGKCKSIVDDLVEQVDDLQVIVNSAKAKEEEFRKKSSTSPEKDKRNCIQSANFYKRYKEVLSDSENDRQIQMLIPTLRKQLSELQSKLVTNLEQLDSPDRVWQQVLASMQEDNFDKALISFLRIASSLHYILNFLDEDNVIIDDDYEYQSVFESHMARAVAKNPEEDYLKGSFCEVSVLELLFEQPINFVSCESLYEVPYPDQKTLVSHFNKGRTPFKGMKPLFILQRSEHIGLILV